MSLLGGGVGVARHNTHSPNTGTRIVDGSAIPAGVAGAGGGGLIGSLMAGQMVASSKRNRDLKKHLKANKQKRDGMKNEEVVTEGDARLGRLTGAMQRLTARKAGRIQSGTVQDAASQSISGSLGARSANAAYKPGLAGALQRAQKQNILRDSGLSNPATIKPQFGMANGLQQADARGIVARQTVGALRQGYTVNRLQASTGGAEHKIVLAGGPPKRRVVQVGSDISDQISLGRYTGTLATRQRDKKEMQKDKQANSVNLFRGRALTDEFHGNTKQGNYMTNEEYTQILEQMIISLTGMELEELHEAVGGHLKEGTGYSPEEVKSGKTRSGRPHPEAKFPGWKVGENMLTQKVKNGKKK